MSVPIPSIDEWKPVSVGEAFCIFSEAPFRWWISGGNALDLHIGKSWRTHDDIDVGFVRSEAEIVYGWMKAWDLWIASGGALVRWRGEQLHVDEEQNNVWARKNDEQHWSIDLTVGDGDSRRWAYRRDSRLSRPWEEAVLHTDEGVPYLAPDLQLLFKSKDNRPKDDVDAAEVIPLLDERQRRFLNEALPFGHPWRDIA